MKNKYTTLENEEIKKIREDIRKHINTYTIDEIDIKISEINGILMSLKKQKNILRENKKYQMKNLGLNIK
jgi:hypothetical protein